MKTKILIGSAVCLFVALFSFYIFCLNHVSPNEIGVAYNSWDGSLKIQPVGWHRTSAMVKVTCLPTIPVQVDINQGLNYDRRVITAKIIQLNTNGIVELIKLQGFSYHLGASFQYIMSGYAYSGKQYPFLDIIQEANQEQIKK